MLEELLEHATATPAELMLASTIVFCIGGALLGASVYAGPAALQVLGRVASSIKYAWRARTGRKRRELARQKRFAGK